MRDGSVGYLFQTPSASRRDARGEGDGRGAGTARAVCKGERLEGGWR